MPTGGHLELSTLPERADGEPVTIDSVELASHEAVVVRLDAG